MSTDAVRPPVGPWTPHPVRIEGMTTEARDTVTFELRFEDPQRADSYRFSPGQFNMVYLPGVGESAISISSDPRRVETIAHTVREVGDVTRAMSRKQVGDQLLLRGPFGSSWPMATCRGRDVVIACGGIGLAPLRSVIYEVARDRDQYGEVTLLYGARTPDDLLFAQEYEAWRRAGIRVETTVDAGNDRWQGQIGVVTTIMERARFDAPRTILLTCGPEIMMRFVIFEALSRDVDPGSIYLSMERNMSCAVGFCGHCQIGPAFVCKDGPVFTFARMEPYLHYEEL